MKKLIPQILLGFGTALALFAFISNVVTKCPLLNTVIFGMLFILFLGFFIGLIVFRREL